MNDRQRFPVLDRHIWLNHAAIAPWPAAVAEAMQAFVESNLVRGPIDYPDWLRTESRLRERAAALLGGQTDDIALVKNTSEGLGLIAAGTDWQPGDAVVCCAGDFPSNLLPWHQLVPDQVEVREVPIPHDDPEQAIIDALDRRARIVAVSAVRYDTGIRLDLDRIGRACRDHGARLVVDAIQQLGALPLNVTETPVDFVVAGSHKWLLAPEGLALFWSRGAARHELRPVQAGWRMWPDMFNFARTDWRPPSGARRFEPGTLNMAGIHALDAALGVLLALDPATRARQLLDRTGSMIEALAAMPGVEVLTPSRRERRAGIVAFRPTAGDADRIVRELARRDIYAARRGEAVRLSPNFYTPTDQIEHTLGLLERLMRGRAATGSEA